MLSKTVRVGIALALSLVAGNARAQANGERYSMQGFGGWAFSQTSTEGRWSEAATKEGEYGNYNFALNLAAQPTAKLSIRSQAYWGQNLRGTKNPAVAVERADLARLFMKRVSAWSDGTPVTVVDQERTAPVRVAFSKEVHKKDADAVAAQWATLVYSGRDVPPSVKRSDDEVLEFVRQTPGAVGYVSMNAPLSGVKVLALR